jgi:hypothetical protein
MLTEVCIHLLTEHMKNIICIQLLRTRESLVFDRFSDNQGKASMA